MEGICEVCEREKRVSRYKKGPILCNAHKKQMRLFGKIKFYTCMPNKIVKYEDYAEIIIVDKIGKEIARTKIDLDDVPKVEGKKWTKDGRNPFYIRRREKIDGKYKTILLHRFIMNSVENSKLIDHKNRDVLDNRKNNLRFVTFSESNINKKRKITNTSGKTGVAFDKERNRWKAFICLQGKHCLKRFKYKEDAIMARTEMELKYFGVLSPE